MIGHTLFVVTLFSVLASSALTADNCYWAHGTRLSPFYGSCLCNTAKTTCIVTGEQTTVTVDNIQHGCVGGACDKPKEVCAPTGGTAMNPKKQVFTCATKVANTCNTPTTDCNTISIRTLETQQVQTNCACQ